ncbi:Cell division coordinator CpoB [Candidatus Magnetaquicoccaceae bacterium FCR-1]|uniref:Cell division coordinator CpoB n=1 Tax=Candidatus Magnetaquiglobus chichijimensis TaxID=3141448 RepID=A0ABQ0C6P0_9PROT
MKTRLRLFLGILACWLLWPTGGEGGYLNAPEAVFSYALDLEKQSDHKRAATEFGRYVSAGRGGSEQAFPRLEEAMFRLAVNLAQANETDGALRAFSELGAAYPKSPFIPMALLRMGLIYERAGAREEAVRRYQRLAEMGMDTELSALSRLRLAWLSMGKPGEEEVARGHLLAVDHPKMKEPVHDLLLELDRLPQLPYRDPWISGLLSAAVPGAGHLYLNRPEDAGVALLSNGLLLAGTIQAFSKGISGLGAALGVVELGWYSGTIFSAVSLTHKQNQRIREDHLNHIWQLQQPKIETIGLEMEWRY